MAKKEKSKKRKRPEIIKVPVNCPFCKSSTEPDYKEYKVLARYLTDRAKIIGSGRSGICAKHQRRLAVAIKRTRQIGLLPFTPSV
jgi:small subunit ribosomal protein S18